MEDLPVCVSRHLSLNTVYCNHELCALDGLGAVSKHSMGQPYMPSFIVMLYLLMYQSYQVFLTKFGFQVVISFAELGKFDLHYLLTLWNLTNLIGLGIGAHMRSLEC